MDRAQKAQEVKELGQAFTDSGVVVVAHYAGLTVANMSELRIKMRAAEGTVRVAKNKLAKIALEGTPCEGIKDLLTGQTVLAYSVDPVAAAKVMQEFSKGNEKLVILGGSMGSDVLDVEGVKAVAAMPSRDEVIASIVGCIIAPAANIAAAASAPASDIAGILSTLEEREAA